MNEAILFAVQKLVKSKFSAPVGKTKVSGTVTVDVDAEITKSPDELYAPSVHIPYLKVFANFAKISGITRDKAIQNFKLAMQNSLNNNTDAGEELEGFVSDLEKFETLIQKEVIDQLPKQLRAGKTAVKGKINVQNHLLLQKLSEAV